MNVVESIDLGEIIRLISIENHLFCGFVTNEEANFINELANNKCYPRAEYLVACMFFFGIGVVKNKVVALRYLDLCSKHAGYSLQIKIAEIYHKLGNYRNVKMCLERALHDYEIQECD